MDLALLARVLWRHKIIVGLGFTAAIMLAFLSFAKVGFSHGFKIQPRQHQEWQSIATLLVSQHGFPAGRTAAAGGHDPTQFSAYALIYAHLATGDPVKRLMLRDGPIDTSHEFIGATAVLSIDGNTNSSPLPLVNLWAISDPPSRAIELTHRLTNAFIEYLDREQQANRISVDDRVTVTVVTDGSEPLLIKKRSKTLPIVVFLTVAMATAGLAFMLENVQRRRRQVALEATERPADGARRTA